MVYILLDAGICFWTHSGNTDIVERFIMSNKANSGLYSKAVSANDLADNGATVLRGGNIDSSKTVTNAPGSSILGAGRGKLNTPIEDSQVGTTTAWSTGAFATLPEGIYVVKGGNVTTSLAGVAYTGLASAGNPVQQRSINSRLTINTVLIDSWDYATGVPTFNSSNPATSDFDVGSYADPTRAIPGNLVIIDDGITPTVVAYQPKTG